jgi:hypothetical protein
MIAYRFDSAGIYCGEISCQLDPLASKQAGQEVWLLPGHSTFTKPPKAKSGYNIVWSGNEWKYVEIPKPPEPPEPTPEEEKARKLTELDSQYEADKAEIVTAYQTAAIYGDTVRMEKLKADLAALDDKYDEDYDALEQEAE